ncbi:FxsA family protein [Biformimicrobium ophioploci]|uniref:Membrane protein FxsA n=1 Tax=Biformimicrobium ophioploci TaxID=3036711 RepID=A0ABQ6LXM1_9GAMM|nr:FxsA family protein [Microbulbifer sp. NKW57]GMG86824.1 membrane protein FxsA [Microbulbifer sp. NKW57]
MRPLLALFIAIPIIEMWLLIAVGSRIGALPTIALVLLTAIIGVGLLRQQGLATLARANQKMATGEMPAGEMVEGIFLAVGGALLLTPGFFTDALGFACLIPGVRHWLVGGLLKRFFIITPAGRGPGTDGETRIDIIEGEFRREERHERGSAEPPENRNAD